MKKSIQTIGTETLTTSYEYDLQDGLIKVTDPRLLETHYVNDDLGRRWKTISPDTGTTEYEYDPAGNLMKTTDANGVIVERAYDALNRPIKVSYEDSSLDVSYEYDAPEVPFGIGRKTAMIDPSGTTMYSYDQRGLLKSEEKEIDGLSFFTGYEYDPSGNLIELRYPSIDPTTRQGAVNYMYDDAERLAEVDLQYNGDTIKLAVDLAYKPFGPRTSMTLGNTLVDSRTFDTRYQPSHWKVMDASSQNILSYTDLFNPDGNLEAIQDSVDPSSSGGSRTFGYDEIHRLTSATGPWGAGEGCPGDKTYAYDNNGNRTCNGESGAATNYTYSTTSNRLDTSVHTSYSYDDNGNITADGVHALGYSDANRLATVNEDWPTYQYDGEGRRVRKASNITTYFFYDPSGRILTELTPNTQAYGGGVGHGNDYVYLPDAPLARVDWSVINNPDYHQCAPRAGVFCPPPRIEIADLLYYHTDHLGTPIAMSNQDGELVWKAEYRPFGELFSNAIADVGNNLRFPGQYFDQETGLHQNWFRDYDPKTGRYRAADPIGLAGGLNPYSYANNSPANWIDPVGLESWFIQWWRGLFEPDLPPTAGQAGFDDALEDAAGNSPYRRGRIDGAHPGAVVGPGAKDAVATTGGVCSEQLALQYGAPAAIDAAMGGTRFVIGTAARAAEVGAMTPSGLTLSLDAATRLAGRMGGKLGLAELDAALVGPGVRTFADAAKPGTLRVFNPSITRFGGEGLNVVINPATNTVVTVFPSSAAFVQNAARFSEILP